MVCQVIVRLTLYLDQAFRRGSQPATSNTSTAGIENTVSEGSLRRGISATLCALRAF